MVRAAPAFSPQSASSASSSHASAGWRVAAELPRQLACSRCETGRLNSRPPLPPRARCDGDRAGNGEDEQHRNHCARRASGLPQRPASRFYPRDCRRRAEPRRGGAPAHRRDFRPARFRRSPAAALDLHRPEDSAGRSQRDRHLVHHFRDDGLRLRQHGRFSAPPIFRHWMAAIQAIFIAGFSLAYPAALLIALSLPGTRSYYASLRQST